MTHTAPMPPDHKYQMKWWSLFSYNDNYDLRDNPMAIPEPFSNIGISREDPTDPDVVKRNFVELFDEYLADTNTLPNWDKPMYLYYLECKDTDEICLIDETIYDIQDSLKDKGQMSGKQYHFLCNILPRLKWVKITYHPTEAAKVELEP